MLILAAFRSSFGTRGISRSLSVVVAATDEAAAPAYKTLKVQVIHRHGDRSPITPLKDVQYWEQQLVAAATQTKVAADTQVRRDQEFHHAAGARGPFGQLSQLGLLQMIQVGTTLAHELTQGESLFYTPLFSAERPLHPNHMSVYATDFARTIMSVQGLLVGFFPDGIDSAAAPLTIDVRHTSEMIPDPQPRRFPEQQRLEEALNQRPHVLQREGQLLPLAVHATAALANLLGDDAHEVSFGVVQESTMSIELEPLAWNQLAEITKCLETRQRLPTGLTVAEQQAIATHTAWRWFQTLSHPRLIYLAMHDFCRRQMDVFRDDASAPLTIWSAHDSTLIGLLCAYRLERPAVWPEYASYLVLELVEDIASQRRFVRFSLNGQRLQSQWEDSPAYDAIPLSVLLEKVETVGATSSDFAATK
jgi:acid phosphatase